MIKMYFGLPGSGKTTLAVKHAYDAIKSEKYPRGVYSNFPIDIKGVTLIKNDDIGKYDLDYALILIDEASVYADNRGFKNFDKYKIDYFLLHRHHHNDINLYTQGYNAVDKKIRSVTDRLYWIRKLPFRRWITKAYRIPYGIGFTATSENGHSAEYGDICEGYRKPSMLSRLFAEKCVRRRYYKYFDSWDCQSFETLPNSRTQGKIKIRSSLFVRVTNFVKTLKQSGKAS